VNDGNRVGLVSGLSLGLHFKEIRAAFAQWMVEKPNLTSQQNVDHARWLPFLGGNPGVSVLR
jgi:hypothetical protein